MPITPLVDLADYDLSQTIHGKDQLYERLSQAGRFALVDGVLAIDDEQQLIIGYKDVRGDEWWAEDHIPGRPLFPGTLMVEASAQLSTYDFLVRKPDLDNAFIGFIGIENTKFRNTVEPDCRLVLVCKIARLRKTMFTYEVQGFVNGEIAFESRISGVAL